MTGGNLSNRGYGTHSAMIFHSRSPSYGRTRVWATSGPIACTGSSIGYEGSMIGPQWAMMHLHRGYLSTKGYLFSHIFAIYGHMA